MSESTPLPRDVQSVSPEVVGPSNLALLEVEGLTVTRRGADRPLLADVSFRQEEGCFGIVTGRSGVGKSLLFQAILGLLPEAHFEVEGLIRFRDRLILGVDGYDRRELESSLGRRIVAVFQEPTSHLHPSLSIGWQLRETWDRSGWRVTAKDAKIANDRLAAVALGDRSEESMLSRYAFQLSQGQQQRVMFAMATGGAELVLADEPTSSLDEATEREIVALIRAMREEGSIRSMLSITHNLDAFRPFLNSRDWVLEIKAEDGIGGANAPKAVFGVPPLLAWDEDPQVDAEPGSQHQAVLRVEELSVEVGAGILGRTRRLLDGISFEVGEGEFFSVSGPSGCGKTTLAKTLLGLIPPSEGQMLFRASPEAEPVRLKQARSRALRQQIQMIFQDALSTFDPKITIGETLSEVLRYAGVRSSDEQEDRVRPLLEDLGLVAPGGDAREILERFPSEFSGGQRQRLGVIRALVLEPRLLIADEPFASQDVETALEMVDLFSRMRDRYSIALVLISHDRRLVSRLCRRGIELVDGSMREDCDAVNVSA